MVKTQSFITPKYGDELEGTIGINTKGFGFVKVLSLEQSVEIPQHDLNTALHGDGVRLKITGKNKFGQFVGEVLEVIKRSKHGFAGTLFKEKNMYFVKAQDARMYTEIMIPESALNGAEAGQKVFAKITDWTDPKKSPWGVIHTVLGKPGQNDAEVSAYALERGFNTSFPIDVEEEARIIEEKGITEEDLKDRRDFRNVLTCTIDPFDAKDFDDALSFQKLTNGNYEVGVHIADVSHYVKEDSALDKEARERATSVYLVD
ncbi:MAG: RNB domain-containing ribonuclease, partial [Minisyncoccia bacterium]